MSVAMIQSLAECSEVEAEKALLEHGSVVAAVDSLLARTVVSGEKHIPQVQKSTHNEPEQEERCAAGRALMDKLTVVTSAAQTKIQSGQPLAVDAVRPAELLDEAPPQGQVQ